MYSSQQQPIATSEICPICEQPMFISSTGILSCYCGHTEHKLSLLLELKHIYNNKELMHCDKK